MNFEASEVVAVWVLARGCYGDIRGGRGNLGDNEFLHTDSVVSGGLGLCQIVHVWSMLVCTCKIKETGLKNHISY